MFANLFRLGLIVGALPVTLTNGTTADATQVMSDLNWIVNQVNANAAPLANTALLNANNNFTAVQSGIAATQAANFPIASQVQNSSLRSLTSTLGTNTITTRIAALALAAYASQQVFTFIPSQQNTGPVNISIDGLAPTNLLQAGSALMGGELRLGIPCQIEMDGTAFNILGPFNGGKVRSSVRMTSGSFSVESGLTQLSLGVVGFPLRVTTSPGGVGDGIFIGSAANSGILTTNGAACNMDLQINSANKVRVVAATGNLLIGTVTDSGSNNGMVVCPAAFNNTTASAASALWLADGSAARTTSSLEFKRMLRDLTLDEARSMVFGNRAFWYSSLCKVDDPEQEFLGYGAEFVVQDEKRAALVSKDVDGRLYGVQYDRFVVPQGMIIESHDERLASLEARLAKLEKQ